MPRIYARSSKGRIPLLRSPVPLTRSKTRIRHVDVETSSNSSRSPTESSPRSTRARFRNARNKQTSAQGGPSGSEESGHSGGGADEDENDEDNSEEPDFAAPSRAKIFHETGRKISLVGNIGTSSPKPREVWVAKSDDGDSDEADDEIYEGVNNISDSEDIEEEDMEAYEMQGFIATESDDSQSIIDIDGVSLIAFGPYEEVADEQNIFSGGSDGTPEENTQRHVHFPTDLDQPKLLNGSVSPLLTRALLPSALPEEFGIEGDNEAKSSSQNNSQDVPWDDRATRLQRQRGAFEDPDDCDATDEDLPAEAHTTPIALHQTSMEAIVNEEHFSPPSHLSRRTDKKSSPRRKGPRRGFFTVDKDKPWAILDPSENRVVFLPAPETGRHEWLDERINQPYSNSAEASPAISLAQLLDESDQSVTSSQANGEIMLRAAKMDLMLSGLNSNQHSGADRGHATGPSEAFYPLSDFQIVGDYLVGPEDMDDQDRNSDVSNEAHLNISLDNFIKYDSDDASDDEDSPTSPVIAMPPLDELPGTKNIDDEFAHLNNRNVTAFRRNADSSFANTYRNPTFPALDHDVGQPHTMNASAPARKRKATNPPYQDRLYDGVTPMQRKIIHTTKRRKLTA